MIQKDFWRGWLILRWYSFSIHWLGVNFEVGKFESAPTLLNLCLFEFVEDYPDGYCGVVIFDIKIWKISLSLNWWRG